MNPTGNEDPGSKRLRVVFLGTSAFAESVLLALQREHRVVGVATQPDRPAGRGRRLAGSRIKRLAQHSGLPLWQPERIRRRAEWEPLAALAPDCLVVADYGQILPAGLLAAPRLGAVNVHASLLPALRGAAPAIWALARGHRRTGVTTMLMDRGLDTGPILLQRGTDIRADDTGGGLLARLAPLGAELLLETLSGLAARAIEPRPQTDENATFAPRVQKADAALDWRREAWVLANRVRAFSPAPTAFTALPRDAAGGPRLLRIHRAGAAAAPLSPRLSPGSFWISGPARAPLLSVACAQRTALLPTVVQAAGRRRLAISDFLRGAGLGGGGAAGRFLEADQAAAIARGNRP